MLAGAMDNFTKYLAVEWARVGDAVRLQLVADVEAGCADGRH